MHALNSRSSALLMLILVSLALAASLTATSANRSANRRMAGFLAVLAGMGASYIVGLSHLAREWRGMRYLPLSVPLALGPLLFSYTVRLTRGSVVKREWLHFAPAALQLAYLLSLFALPPHWQDLLSDGRGRDRLKPIFDLALPLSLGAYAVLCLQALAEYRRWLSQARSDEDLFAARWLRNLLVVLLFTLALEVAIRLSDLLGRPLTVFDVYPFYLWLLTVGVYLGVEARRYSERPFPQIVLIPVSPAEPQEQPTKAWDVIGTQWRAQIATEGWWREGSLTLAEAARRLGTNTAYLSRASNEGLGMNFSEMINAMRAEEVARVLTEGEHAADLLMLAYEAGFSSKASFNRAFRARFGESPSAFRARVRTRS